MVGSRMKSGREFQTVGPETEKADGHQCWAGSEVLQAVNGWRNASATECRHRRPERNSPTGTAVRGRSDTGELSLLVKHPVGDVESVKFVMQYLTQAAVKLPSAGDDTRSSVQHTL